jgi:hypothetical protein
MGRKPSPDMTLERINNDKGYHKENCMWATQSEQKINQRINTRNTSGTTGVYYNKRENNWEARIWPRQIGQICLGYFTTKEEAIVARRAAEGKYHAPIVNEKLGRKERDDSAR